MNINNLPNYYPAPVYPPSTPSTYYPQTYDYSQQIANLERRCNNLDFQVAELKRMLGDVMMNLPKTRK